MRLTVTAGLLTVLLAAAPVRAQTPGACALGTAQNRLDASQVEATLFNTGSLFYGNGSEAAYVVPRYVDRSPVYAAGLWLGGKVGGTLRTAAATYQRFEFWPGPLGDGATLPNPADCSAYDRIWVVSTNDVAAYEATGQATPDLQEWPVGLGAEAIDASGNPVVVTSREQTINLGVGERPVIYGSQTAFWVMNDVGNAHASTGSAPLGVEVQATAWVMGSEDDLDLDRASFYRYRVINRSTQPIDSLIAAFFADSDLGDASDDYMGVDTLRSMAFAYNADNEDTGTHGYGTPPPAVGYDLLATGAGAHMVFYGSAPVPMQDPLLATEHYFIMQGRWTDGTPMTEWGQGYPPNGPVTTFTYPGDPVTGAFWSEGNTGAGTNSPGDRRQVVAAPPHTLGPGEAFDVTLALVFGWGEDHLDSITRLRAASDRIQAAHDDGTLFEPASIPPETVLVPPTRLAPPDGSLFNNQEPALSWSPVEGAARYRLEVWEPGQLPRSYYTDSTSYYRNGFLPGRQHTGEVNEVAWRVRAETARAASPYSSVGHFSYWIYRPGPLLLRPDGDPDAYTNMAFVEVLRPGGAAACEPGDTSLGCPQVGGDLIYQSFNSTSWWVGFHGGEAGPEATVGLFAPSEFEIRFTAEGSLAYHAFSTGRISRVPFEVWDIGSVRPFQENDPSDDIQLVVAVHSEAGRGEAEECTFDFGDGPTIFGLGTTTDWIYAYYPATTYAAWAAAAEATNPDTCPTAPATDAAAAQIDLARGHPLQRFLMEDATGGAISVADLAGSVVRFYTRDPVYTAGEEGSEAPAAFALGAAYPNPFAHRLTIPFTAGAAGPVRVALYDVLGRRVAVLAEGERAAGPHQVEVETAGLAAGVYVVVLEAEGVRLTQRVVHLK